MKAFIAEKGTDWVTARNRKVSATLGPEGLSARIRKAWANASPEQRAQRVRNQQESRMRTLAARRASRVEVQW